MYQTEFRPVPLEEFIKVGSTIYNQKMDIVRTVPKAADLGGKDPEHIVELCNEVEFYLLLFFIEHHCLKVITTKTITLSFIRLSKKATQC